MYRRNLAASPGSATLGAPKLERKGDPTVFIPMSQSGVGFSKLSILTLIARALLVNKTPPEALYLPQS
jgi:hypothetical protein